MGNRRFVACLLGVLAAVVAMFVFAPPPASRAEKAAVADGEETVAKVEKPAENPRDEGRV